MVMLSLLVFASLFLSAVDAAQPSSAIPSLEDFLANYTLAKPQSVATSDLQTLTDRASYDRASFFHVFKKLPISDDEKFGILKAELTDLNTKLKSREMGNVFLNGLEYEPVVVVHNARSWLWWAAVVTAITVELGASYVLLKKVLEYREACARYEFE